MSDIDSKEPMMDLNEAVLQRQVMHGPLPKGSRALLRITLEKSRNPVNQHPCLCESKTGITQLPLRFEIASGQYAGYHWYERITVPEKFQKNPEALTEGQKFSCRIGGAILRGILESAFGIDPEAKDEESMQKRRIDSWESFSGLIFPAKLDIDKMPIIRDGQVYWRNSLKYVLPVTDPDYEYIMAGGEYISKGVTFGQGIKE